MENDDELEAEIHAQVGEWSSNSNECINITLLRADNSKHASFQPDFTYEMFGEEQAIFGYQDLAIDLTFRAHDMKPNLEVNYGKKYPAQDDIQPTDISEALRDFLPEEAFSAEPTNSKSASAFLPPGEKIHQYSRDGNVYEVWCASLEDPKARQLVQNMQILVPMFIEGGQMLELEEDWITRRWKLFTLYQHHRGKGAGYSLIGYGTSYRVFAFPDRKQPDQSDLDLLGPSEPLLELLSISAEDPPKSSSLASPLDLPSRERLSQFLILPSFHGAGHGIQLYQTMYSHLAAPPNVREFTIEDPNEAFDDLRDLCDMLYLRASEPEFAALRINTKFPADKMESKEPIPTDLIVPGEVRERIRRKTKIDKRQFDRLVEMHVLSFIPPLHRSRSRTTRREKSTNENDKAYYLWRLYAKQRLYIFNRDQLVQVDHEERVEKLEAALDSVQENYISKLERVEAREAEGGNDSSIGGAEDAAVSKRAGKKRRVVEEDDEDEDEEEEKPKTNGSNKRAKLVVVEDE